MKNWIFAGLAAFGAAGAGVAQVSPFAQAPRVAVEQAALGAPQQLARPSYDLNLKLDWKLLSFRASGKVGVPVRAGEKLNEAVFFVFANAGGVGGADASHPHVAIDRVRLNGAPLKWKMDGAVLRVALPTPQTGAFTLDFEWHGVIPRLPASGGIGDLMGGAGADISGLLGGLMGGGTPDPAAAAAAKKKEENTDFGLYGFADGVLSLGAFWYPTLAVRENGRWIDEAPRGLGDVSFAEASDYTVSIEAPPQVLVAAPGVESKAGAARSWRAGSLRDFAILASDQFTRQSKPFDVGGRTVRVEAWTTKKNAAKSSQAIEIAGRSLQVFAKRFGPYPNERFAVVEGPLRAGAGGMEYSGMTAIASVLYGDLQAQLGAMTGMAGALSGGGPLGGLLGELEQEAYGGTGAAKAPAAGASTSSAPVADPFGGFEGLGAAGDMLKQQGALLGSLFEATIAHEVAHQWWAIGVGSDSQRAPWVDESLTNWSAMLYFEDRYGRARAEQMMEAHLKGAYATARMLGIPDGAAARRTSDFASNIQYGALVYGKGALFYDRLRTLLGDEAFFRALKNYYASHNGRLADGGALLQSFKQAAPIKAAQTDALFARWFREAHGDDDITGGTAPSLSDLLGPMLGGAMGME
jgi:hypothetical protein